MSATISIVDLKQNDVPSDEEIKEKLRKEFEVPDYDINNILSAVKDHIHQIINHGKLESCDLGGPGFSVSYYIIKQHIIKEYDVADWNRVILNIHHINKKD